MPLAVSVVPSIGSTATSHSGPVPSPTCSPLKSIGALSFSPSPITTMPLMPTRGDHRAHRVDGDAVGAVLVAAADPAAGGHRGRLGDPHQLEGEVAVRGLVGGGRGLAVSRTVSHRPRSGPVAARARAEYHVTAVSFTDEPHLAPRDQPELGGRGRGDVGEQLGAGVDQHPDGVAVRRDAERPCPASGAGAEPSGCGPAGDA